MKTQLVTLAENTEVKVTEDTQFVLQFPAMAGEKYSLNVIFEKPGVSGEIIGIYSLKKDQSVDLTTISTHKAPHTTCFTRIKGALYDNAKSSYTGKIIIEKPAQQTQSFLEDNILVLGNETLNTSQPILEIEADDVKASHGSTTGRINEEQVYYLESRGLDKTEAQTLIVDGFFESLVNKIEDATVAEAIRSALV
ncbi:MAG TPA: SufD family Fe-S cluster assembly protein [Candidatus Saccharimonadales bacterium]|nr:SufD family Fe-S cluster assembly protein [Candidatus Saccharimonadales bacterium]